MSAFILFGNQIFTFSLIYGIIIIVKRKGEIQMENLILKLKALTHEGFGSPDYYKEIYTIPNCPEAIHDKVVEFALKYGVELDSVKIEKCKKT